MVNLVAVVAIIDGPYHGQVINRLILVIKKIYVHYQHNYVDNKIIIFYQHNYIENKITKLPKLQNNKITTFK